MNEKQLKEVTITIKGEIEKTKTDIVDYREASKPIAPDVSIGRISRIDAINNKSVIEAALRTAENKLNSLEQILLNVDKKDFGLCAQCQQPIPIQRMLLVPHSRFCVNCASQG